MKLKSFLYTLNTMVDSDPALGELEVVVASSDDGNSYNRVEFSPTVGIFDGQEQFAAKPDDTGCNAICVN